jgi:signal transduction histidine kinase
MTDDFRRIKLRLKGSFIFLIVLVLVVILISRTVIYQKLFTSDDISLITNAREQLYCSQKITLFAIDISQEVEGDRKLITKNIDSLNLLLIKFKERHSQLMEGKKIFKNDIKSKNGKGAEEIFNDLDIHFSEFVVSVNAFLKYANTKGKTVKEIEAIKEKNDVFLVSVNKVLKEGRIKAGERFSAVRQTMFWIPIFVVVASILGYVFIFLPVMRKLDKSSNLMESVTERLSLATKTGNIGIWEYDVINDNLIWDDTMYSMYGMTKEMGEEGNHIRNWFAKIHPDEVRRVKKELYETLKAGVPIDSEFRIVWEDKSVHHIYAKAVTTKNNKGKVITVTGTNLDITSIKEAEEGLKTTISIVGEQNSRLLNFAYIVSHNLRSHAGNFQMILNILETAEDEEEKNEMVEYLKGISENLSETIKHLNEVVQIQTQPNVSREKINLSEYVDRTIKIVQAELSAKEGKIINKIPSDVEIEFNVAYLESVLLNFLTNGIKYSHPDRVPEIILEIEYKNQQPVLVISDNGSGIDLEKYGEKLFGLYKTFHRNADSKGIGLFITKNQVEAMGGRIEVESEVGIGTTFKIFFKK